jgi:adenylate cyclase
MEAIYAEELETRSGELAYHYEQACLQDKPLTGKAIHYLKQAGQQAVRQYANQEAVVYYRRGLDILQSQPETKRNMQQEIELQIALGVPVIAIHGYTSPEIKRIYDRAYDLCKKVGDSADLFTSLVGLSRFYGLTGDLEARDRLGEQLLAIAQAANNPDYLLEAYRQMGGRMFAAGRLQEARKFCERGLDLYDPKRHESYAYRFGHDPAVTFLGFLSQTLWLLGYPDQAQEQSQKLYSLIFTMTNPPSQAYAYCHLAVHACMCVEAIVARSHAEAAIQLSQLHGLASWMALATALKGWAIFEHGQAAEGDGLLEEGVQAWRMRRFAHFTPFLLALQAEACLKMQKLKEGRDAVMTALEIGRRGGDQYWLAEINRLQGELLLACGGEISSVEAHFQQAVEIACKQEARMLELRAVMSLARLWHTQGRVQAAAQALAQVYDRFTEGFDTSDLKAASTLLQDLA